MLVEIRHGGGGVVDLAGQPLVGGGLVAGQGLHAHSADRGLPLLPVLAVRVQEIGLRGEVAEGEGAGSDRLLVGVGREVLDLAPEVLGDDPGAAQRIGPLDEGGRRVGEHDGRVVARLCSWGGAGGVQGLVVLDRVEGEGDVARGEGGAVRPAHPGAHGHGEHRAVLVPLEALAELGHGVHVDRGERVVVEERLVDQALHHGQHGRGVGVEVLGEAGSGSVVAVDDRQVGAVAAAVVEVGLPAAGGQGDGDCGGEGQGAEGPTGEVHRCSPGDAAVRRGGECGAAADSGRRAGVTAM